MKRMNSNDPMHILLTNDDGHEAPGILTLQSVLKSKGYRVTMVAPSSEQSATSMSTTTRRTIPLADLGGGSWHLDAQPADTVLVALRHLLADDPPQLVLSGINFGPNLGVGLHASGTIGAAITALLNGLPAIAVSAGMLFEEARQSPRTFPSTFNVLGPAAEFTCTVIESLRTQANSNGRLLPPGILLNINYPALPREKIKGVIYPEVSSGHLIELDYHRCEKTGHVTPRYYAGVNPEQPHREEGDVRAHMEGYITVSPVKPSWNPPAGESAELIRQLDLAGLDY
ncbi:MAG: 5'/3'-nucleotidase SurE [Xanthomonadales bacterium]|nr:5'/3'-nucleotidase SurE [Gammaproteobacteria bacterium]NND56086.1 5'/3'-nucleotidase SurE [Xanthomonadales bacterium]